MKALEAWQIADIIKQHEQGKTLVELAQLYNVHYKTIANYIKDGKPAEGLNIKVFFNVQDNEKKQTFNYYGVVDRELMALEIGGVKIPFLKVIQANGIEGLINMNNVNQIVSI